MKRFHAALHPLNSSAARHRNSSAQHRRTSHSEVKASGQSRVNSVQLSWAHRFLALKAAINVFGVRSPELSSNVVRAILSARFCFKMPFKNCSPF